DTLKVVVKMDPRNAEAFVFWGDLLLDKYNQPEAIDSYNDALKIDPKMPEAQLGLAKAFALSDPEKAQKALDTATSVNKNYPEAQLVIANQFIESEQYDKAEGVIAEAQKINPQSSE